MESGGICIGKGERDGNEKPRICISLRLMGREGSNELNALYKSRFEDSSRAMERQFTNED